MGQAIIVSIGGGPQEITIAAPEDVVGPAMARVEGYAHDGSPPASVTLQVSAGGETTTTACTVHSTQSGA